MNKLILCLPIFIASLGVSFLTTKKLIPYLTRRAKQPIYEGGPSWHISKSGTPTMGGISFLLSIFLTLGSVAVLMYLNKDFRTSISILIILLFAVGNALIGVFDDMVKLKRKENAGLTPGQKLFLQFLLTVIFLLAIRFYISDGSSVAFSFGQLNLGLFYYPLSIILLLGVINCANLTDGVDGLASCSAISICSVFLIMGAISLMAELAFISSAVIGGVLGFLFFNRHPAKIFMGDTGSLFLGALVAGLAFCTSNPFSIILIGGVYVIEGVSVILQVVVYKITKKRLFKMAPLHHHLERNGFSENKICFIWVLATALLSLLSFLIFRW